MARGWIDRGAVSGDGGFEITLRVGADQPASRVAG